VCSQHGERYFVADVLAVEAAAGDALLDGVDAGAAGALGVDIAPDVAADVAPGLASDDAAADAAAVTGALSAGFLDCSRKSVTYQPVPFKAKPAAVSCFASLG